MAEDEVDASIWKQEDCLERINKAFNNYKKSPKERITVNYIEIRLEALENLWKKFGDSHDEIVSSMSKEERGKLTYFKNDFYTQCEDVYIEYKTKLKDDLKSRVQSSESRSPGSGATSTASPNCEVKLPQIQLPKFSGGYEEWQTFHDMFQSLIHKNTNLSPVQKLHYLKSSLSGEAEHLLKNLSTTETNYDEAWSQLTRRYSNKRYNANEVMKRLFSQKPLTTESANAIKQLLDTTSACLKSLENLHITTSSWDAIINHLVISKLDQESRKLWEVQVSQTESDELPTWNELKKFLETRFRTLEMLDGGKSTVPTRLSQISNLPKQSSRPLQSSSKSRSFHSTVNDEKNTSNVCVMCSGQHVLYQCKQFGKQSPEERSEYVQSKGLCFNCLSSNHSVKSCHTSTCCRRCGRRHHTLLHFERSSRQDSAPVESSSPEKPSNSAQSQQASRESETNVVAHFAKESHQGRVLLATALVKVKSRSGYSLTVRALIDQGSEASFMSEEIAQSLVLQKLSVNGLVTGVGDGQTRIKTKASFEVESLHNPEFSIPVNAFVLKKLTSFLPSHNTTIPNWAEIQNLPLADPSYGTPKKIDVILGVEVYSQILQEGLFKHPSSCGPVAQNTQLGWILSGRVGDTPSADHQITSLHVQVKEDQLLKLFWEIEREPDGIGKRMTKEEMKCEEFYEESTTRNREGRYIVRLPFKSPIPECLNGRSREIALRRFLFLEKKLIKNPKLHEEYTEVINNYLEQNHMIELTDEEQVNNPSVVYLPHHAVVREDKETTKVRVVFDASSKGVNNVSLNDTLLVGPKLQQDLRHILMRWRRHAICIVADIVQMYRQILVDESDTDFQRILWRANPTDPIHHYKLLRLTFGTACAPYLAVKSLLQLAKDEQLKYPVAARITLEDFYMDDLLTGCENVEQAITIYEQMKALMNSGGFELQKWASNSDELLDHIKGEKIPSSSVVFKSNDMIKVLGIAWNKTSDNFEYTLQLPESSEMATKRKVLSDIAKLYDPMGWIAPVIITAKIFIQKLWKSGLSWDESLTPELMQEWQNFRGDLTNVKNITIPRWLRSKQDDHVELHTFADASQEAYAAAVFIKTRDQDGNTFINLMTAKTKVAPIEKQLSIPRLELCAALLAAKLVYEVSQIMDVPKSNLFAWSDSTVVLAWIAGEPSRWSTFVSNRVSEILTMLDRNQWRHVSTNYNPADCASRGLSASELIENELWWYGPTWLQKDEYQEVEGTDFDTKEEMRTIKALTTTVECKEDFLSTKFSDLEKMLRVLSYCKKIANRRLPKNQRETPSKIVTAKEKNEIMNMCIKETQNLYFGDDIKHLKSQGHVPKKSKLHTLYPVLDENGILRVAGRIHEAQVKYEKRHPIILPCESHLAKLIVSNAHSRTLHGGPQIMLNLLRSKYWIIRARDLVKKIYRQCVTCVRYSQQNNCQLMGQLPKDRLKPTRPFKISGVDFTGHINIRFAPGRGSKSYKGYICVFICLFSKAIHLEAVSDLTSQGFIAAFRRFVSRRGHCQTLYSDNGTNFVGADKELRGMLNRSLSQSPDGISHLLSNEGTTWKFIPPHAPNFGGLWEAGVRSTKAHLKRVVGDSTLTFEELSTVLTQIEACLNSRPLSYLSDNPNDPMPLTPGHFLVGEPLIVIPDVTNEEKNISAHQRWRYTQKMVNDFWRKWSDEYLVTLNQRYKWTTKKKDPEINDVVIIKDHNLPPAKWLLGKIVEKHSGKDDITRVVTLKTKNGLCKRPCNKLCFLPKAECK